MIRKWWNFNYFTK